MRPSVNDLDQYVWWYPHGCVRAATKVKIKDILVSTCLVADASNRMHLASFDDIKAIKNDPETR